MSAIACVDYTCDKRVGEDAAHGRRHDIFDTVLGLCINNKE